MSSAALSARPAAVPAHVAAAELRELLQDVRALMARWPLPDDENRAWRRAARCRGLDPDWFYPGRGVDPSPAKAVCRQCPVRAHCLASALVAGEKLGTWGGLSEQQRRPLRRLVLVPRPEAGTEP